jgi:hypothetical protein
MVFPLPSSVFCSIRESPVNIRLTDRRKHGLPVLLPSVFYSIRESIVNVRLTDSRKHGLSFFCFHPCSIPSVSHQ